MFIGRICLPIGQSQPQVEKIVTPPNELRPEDFKSSCTNQTAEFNIPTDFCSPSTILVITYLINSYDTFDTTIIQII